MISSDKALRGVAPAARLYSAAVGSLKTGGQPEECVSAQHVALQNGRDVRETLERDPRQSTLDGNALLTQCIDWSARVHNVLYVIAGKGRGGIPPTDNFMVWLFYQPSPRNFDKVDVSNLSDATGSLKADLLVVRLISAPVVPSVWLLQAAKSLAPIRTAKEARHGYEFCRASRHGNRCSTSEFGDLPYGGRYCFASWGYANSTGAWRREVMKAVMLNSADKVQDGDGRRLNETENC